MYVPVCRQDFRIGGLMFKRNFLSITLIAVSVLMSASIASAQGRYANVYSRTDVDNFIRSLEASSDTFSRDFQSAGGTSASERRIVERFENAVDRLRRTFNSNNTWWNSRNDVQGMMGEARQVNVLMNNDRFARRLERQWRELRRDINKLADTYDLPDLAGQRAGTGGGGVFNPGDPWGGWQNTGPMSRPPAWAQGTFRATGYANIIMNIDATGRISLNNNGQMYYGRYNRGQMFLNNDVSTVQRSGQGISTYNRSSGITTHYVREGYVPPGGVGGGDWDGPTSNPPNWAVGTFYATNGSNIQMTINSNGRVTVYNMGQTYTGRYYNGQIHLNNDVSTVSRNGRGIRTYNQSNGVTTEYRRQ